MKRKKEKPSISIGWKLVLIFGIFALIVLFVYWLFQFHLIDTFSESAKKKELTNLSNQIEDSISSDDLNDIAYDIALESNVSVSLYQVLSDSFSPIINYNQIGDVNLIMPDKLNQLYQDTLNSDNLSLTGKMEPGGKQYQKKDLGLFEFEQDKTSNENPDNIQTNQNLNNSNLTYFESRVIKVSDTEWYFLLLTSSVEPLNSTLEVLHSQFWWVFSAFLVLSAIMILVMNHLISKPLVAMNRNVREFAKGKYNVHFEGKGYREITELADTLNHASEELSKLDQLQKELIANISHDLRTPLTMIKGYGEVMRDIPSENTPENVQIIIDETTRLSNLVNDLLDLSKIQSGSKPYVPEIFDLNEALCSTIKRFETFVHHNGYTIEFSPSDDPITVNADKSMILQVLYNLIGNAVNYTGEDKTVFVREILNGNSIRVEVTDTGKGIEEDKLPLIWDRYYRVNEVHQQAVVGTGLGLSIVKGILELHKAKYGVNSTVGKGTTFWFELPVVTLIEEKQR